MTKEEISAMARDMAIELKGQYGASGDGLEESAHRWLMKAIKETEDEATEMAYDLVAAIGSKRRNS